MPEFFWLNEANEHLENILQKKLFDLQCLWRAEKIQLPTVEICFDFEMWSREIMNCPFLEPISQDDINLYTQFILTDEDALDISGKYDCQDYDKILEAYLQDEEYGAWYEFHNNQTGNTSLLLLPNLRGEKEEFYYKLAREELSQLDSPLKSVFDGKPYLWFSDNEQLAEFVAKFEDKETKRWYAAYAERNKKDDSWEAEQLERDVEYLLSIEEPIPVEAHHDIKEAVSKAVNLYRRKKLAEALPVAYEQYLMNLELGISYTVEKNQYIEIRPNILKRLLRGRVLNGEPEDLDF
jgi:hypothetical protein